MNYKLNLATVKEADGSLTKDTEDTMKDLLEHHFPSYYQVDDTP